MSYEYQEIQKLNENEVTLLDGDFKNLYRQLSKHTINFAFDMFEKSNSFEQFKKFINGEKKVFNNVSEHAKEVLKPINDRDVYHTEWKYEEEPWREGLLYQTMRAATEFIINNKDNDELKEDALKLKERIRKYIDLIFEAGKKTTYKDKNGKPLDGYFSIYSIFNYDVVCNEAPASGRWTHDVYNYGCLTEAATYWYRATGDTRLLFLANRFSEFFVDYIFGRDGFKGYMVVPAHEISEVSLENLYLLYKNSHSLVKEIEEKYSCLDGIDPVLYKLLLHVLIKPNLLTHKYIFQFRPYQNNWFCIQPNHFLHFFNNR